MLCSAATFVSKTFQNSIVAPPVGYFIKCCSLSRKPCRFKMLNVSTPFSTLLIVSVTLLSPMYNFNIIKMIPMVNLQIYISELKDPVPANTKHLYGICTTSGGRPRRWSNIAQMLCKCVMQMCLLGIATLIFVRYDVFDVGPTLYKCYTNDLCLLGSYT